MVKVEESDDCGNTSKLTVDDATTTNFEASDFGALHSVPSFSSTELHLLRSKSPGAEHEENNLCSSSSFLKTNLVGMGFSAALVDKVIEENGEHDFNSLLDILFTLSATENTTSEFQYSANVTHDLTLEENEFSFELSSCDSEEIEEKKLDDGYVENKSILLSMNFSVEEIDLAINHFGSDASLPELIDFIIAAQIAGDAKENANSEVITTETFFTTMDKTIRLLKMGFTEEEISAAMDKFGPKTLVSELAESIFIGRLTHGVVKVEKDLFTEKDKCSSQNQNDSSNLSKKHLQHTMPRTKTGEFEGSSSSCFSYDSKYMSKTKKSRSTNDKASIYSSGCFEATGNHHSYAMPEHEEKDFFKRKMLEQMNQHNKNCSRKPPYFFFGNVIDISPEAWQKLSRFLSGTEPEHVNSQFFSAFIRKEGYIHNLPTENRCHVLPRPPMTIQDAFPYTNRWWPSWDTRKQLSYLASENKNAVSQCQSLGRIMTGSQGVLSKEQQMNIFQQCKMMNLLWVGKYELSPIEPDQVEYILGYPPRHTAFMELSNKWIALKHAFQIDTLGYHLSSLKTLYPEGIKVISVFSGIGGAEIALDRLGIHLRCVISVEVSEINRRILRRWWRDSEQTGELRQIEGTQKLSGGAIERIVEEFGGIDLVIAGNPGGNSDGVDFMMFHEFVRIFQRVKGATGRS